MKVKHGHSRRVWWGKVWSSDHIDENHDDNPAADVDNGIIYHERRSWQWEWNWQQYTSPGIHHEERERNWQRDNKNNCRCVLLGKMFVYFRNPNEQNPVGQLNMRDSRVEEVVTSFSCLFQPSCSWPSSMLSPTSSSSPDNNYGGDSPPAGGAYFRLRLWLSGVLGHWGENQKMEIDFQQ